VYLALNTVLSIDLRDAVGDRLHLSDQFVKDGVSLSLWYVLTIRQTLRLAKRLPAGEYPRAPCADFRLVSPTNPSASEIISSAKRRTPNQKKAFGGIRRLFTPREKRKIKKQQAAYRPTYDKVDNGPACRIYGSVEVKKVTANLHITTLGHGYMSHEHTDHQRKS
jgi:hypothetical protein